MGLLGKVKGWLNIGGVKVLLWKYTEPLKRSDPVSRVVRHRVAERTRRPSPSRAARKAAASRQESPWRCGVRKLRVWTLVLMCYAIGALPGVAAEQGHRLGPAILGEDLRER